MSGPVFVKIDEYQDLVDLLHMTEEKLQKANALLQKIKELKNQEDAVLQTWQSELDNVGGRVQQVSARLTPANR